MKRFIPVVFSLVITSVCLFTAAGTLTWPNAWLLLGLNVAASLANTFLMSRNPDLLAERANVKAGPSRDKLLVACTVLLGPVATWVTAGLDTRYHWSIPMPPVAVLAGLALATLAAILVAWAMRTNTFFSAVLRIQKDRGHHPITTGPYALIRHPGYTGMATFTLATPLILNSKWAFAPAAATAALTAVRTALEDKTLQRELEGYPHYTNKVKYRLLPLIW